MKNFIFALLIAVTGIHSASAAPQEFCNALAQMAEAVYEGRAAGVPKTIAVKAAVETMGNNPETLAIGIVVIDEVYNLPSSYVREGAGSLMGNNVFKSCIGTGI